MNLVHRIGKPSLVALALGASLASGCVVAARPPPPPPPRILPAPDAVSLAAQFARSRGLVIDYTSSARLDRQGRWHVDIGGAGGRDRARVVLDGYSGRVLHARLRGPRGEMVQEPQPGAIPPPPPPGQEGNAPPPPPPPQGAPPAPGAEGAPQGGAQPEWTPPPPGPPPPPPSQ
jgi:hypothetical protein